MHNTPVALNTHTIKLTSGKNNGQNSRRAPVTATEKITVQFWKRWSLNGAQRLSSDARATVYALISREGGLIGSLKARDNQTDTLDASHW